MKYLLLIMLCACATTSSIRPTNVDIRSNEIGFMLVPYTFTSIQLRDVEYACLSVEQVKSLGTIRVSGREDDDCDDAAFKTADKAWKKFQTRDKGVAFGVVYIKAYDNALEQLFGNPVREKKDEYRHALNIFINEKKEPYFYEPQTGVALPVFDLVEIGFLELSTYLL